MHTRKTISHSQIAWTCAHRSCRRSIYSFKHPAQHVHPFIHIDCIVYHRQRGSPVKFEHQTAIKIACLPLLIFPRKKKYIQQTTRRQNENVCAHSLFSSNLLLSMCCRCAHQRPNNIVVRPFFCCKTEKVEGHLFSKQNLFLKLNLRA